jgi:hypothetical protein
MTYTSPIQPELDQANKTPSQSESWWKSPRWIALGALAIAVIAAAAAIVALIRPAPAPSFSDQQIAQAKGSVCDAYSMVRRAVFMKYPNAHPGGDPVVQLTATSNERLALLGGGAYLRETTAAQPAAPADLTKAVNSMGITLEQMGLDYIARTNKSVWEPLRKDLGDEVGQINKLCGNNNNAKK